MRAFMIAMRRDQVRIPGVQYFAAVTPEDVPHWLAELDLEWSYPWDKEETAHGMRLMPYRTRNTRARVACFISHFLLWEDCHLQNEPTLILEDDAEPVGDCIEGLPAVGLFGAVSLNDPRGATRRASKYHAAVQAVQAPVAEAPWVDEYDVPQGLPGHSAYMLKPSMAKALIDKAHEVGAWPNDALMCKQFFPGLLGCSTRYYTRVSGRASTLA